MKTLPSLTRTLAGIVALALAVSCSQAAKEGETSGRTVLYNGIELPETWPPR